MRLFTARMKLGMFDPPEMVPYTKIDENELDSAGASRTGAHKIANESMVLLKNDGIAAAEDQRDQDRRRRAARRPDQGSARQLQRHPDPHGFHS